MFLPRVSIIRFKEAAIISSSSYLVSINVGLADGCRSEYFCDSRTLTSYDRHVVTQVIFTLVTSSYSYRYMIKYFSFSVYFSNEVQFTNIMLLYISTKRKQLKSLLPLSFLRAGVHFESEGSSLCAYSADGVQAV